MWLYVLCVSSSWCHGLVFDFDIPCSYLGTFLRWVNIRLGSHCTRTAQSSRDGCSWRVHTIVYQAVYKGYMLVDFYLRKYRSRIIIQLCIWLANFCGLSDSCYSARVIPKMWFVSWEEEERNFAYVLEFMLTFDKMQNTHPLMCTTFETSWQGTLEVIQSFHNVRIVLYMGCSCPGVECLNKINMNQWTTPPLG